MAKGKKLDGLTDRQRRDLDNLAAILKGKPDAIAEVGRCVRRDQQINVRLTERELDLIDNLAEYFDANRTQLIVGMVEAIADRITKRARKGRT